MQKNANISLPSRTPPNLHQPSLCKRTKTPPFCAPPTTSQTTMAGDPSKVKDLDPLKWNSRHQGIMMHHNSQVSPVFNINMFKIHWLSCSYYCHIILFSSKLAQALLFSSYIILTYPAQSQSRRALNPAWI